MGIGLSGINSGLDTDAIIEALVMDKTAKKDKLVKAQTKLEWTQDAWKELNTKIYNFYTKTLSNMRLLGSYNKKTTSISNPTVATISTSSNSVNGTQSLGVAKLAKAGYLTGGVVSTNSGGKASSSTKLSELGVSSGSVNVTVAGKETVINIDGDTTISSFVSQLQSAGVNASFDANNQRFYISAKDSGKDNDFTFTAADGNGIANLKALGLYTNSSKDVEQYATWSNYSPEYVQGLIDSAAKAAETNVAAVTEELQNQLEALTKENQALENTKKLQGYQLDYADMYMNNTIDERTEYYSGLQEKASKISEQLASGKNDAGADLTDTEKTALQDQLADVNLQIEAVKAVDTAIGDDTLTAEDRQKYIDDLTTAQQETADKIASNQAIIDNNDALLNGNAEDIKAIVDSRNAATEAAIKAQYEEKYQTAKDYMTQYNYLNAHAAMSVEDANKKLQEYEDEINNNGDYDDWLDSLSDDQKEEYYYVSAVSRIGDISDAGKTDGTGAVRIEGEDAEIWLNGAKYVSSSNSFSINGLSITAQEVTGTDENGNLKTVSITTSDDVEGIYNMVKDFLKGYNELINEMDALYNAESAKGYEPLTDDEKAEMTDNEIEKWEEKIKGSLLRRDSTLNNVIQIMKNTMLRGVNIDGKNCYLSDFGIETGGYLYAAENERGAYHIDGDEDDSLFASKADKLMAAIISDPDRVAQTLSGIATNLYNNLTTAMRSTTLSSTYTVYNDKQMKEEYNSYTEKIAAQEEKITWWQDYYRSKFTNMETMLASLNSQQSALSGLLG